MGYPTPPNDVAASYDAVANEYALRLGDELEHKPFDREILDAFARRLAGRGRVCDVGCGPGHVAAYLHQRGVDVFGLDVSPQMIEVARRLHPEIDFIIGDVLELAGSDASWSGALAFYSLIHLTPAQVLRALAELGRVLQPGAPLLVAFHIGDEIRHIDEWWERPVSLDSYFFQPDWFTEQLVQARFRIERFTTRAPYIGHEVETERAYIQAQRERDV